jgi:hypothetical protein
LAAVISSAVLQAGTTFTSTITTTKAIAMSASQKAVISAIVVASVIAPLVVEHQAQARLHVQEEAVRQQTSQLAKLRQENDGLSNRLAQATTSAALSQDERNELLKLRGDVGRLRPDVRSFTKIAAFREEIAQLPLEKVWPARVSRLKQWLEEHPSEKVPELDFAPQRRWLNSIYPIPVEPDEECRRAMSIVRENSEASTRNNLAEALRQYAKDHDGQFPAELSQLKPLCNPPLDDEVLGRYTILPASSLVSELRPTGDWVITEKTPVSEADDIRHAIGLGSSRDANRQVTDRWTLLQ